MGELESAMIIRQALLDSLGEKGEDYLQFMNKFFRMKLTREELECELSKYLNTTQLHMHNQLLLSVIKKCAHIAVNANESKPTWNRCSSYISNTFEPIDPIFYEVTERQPVNSDLPPLISQERLLPDSSSMIIRARFAAWEHGLENATLGVADLLSTATHQFVRNIIVAIIRKRKGCYFKNNGFVHSIGSANVNPWLRNLLKHNCGDFHSLKLDTEKGILTPQMRKTKEELDQKRLFTVAASDSTNNLPLAPISINDLLYTLKLHPSLVASYFTSAVNTERMIARVSYPSDD